ncbi:MAG: radical SAM protein, partial [Cytophagia bacterium]|nr:radical SAM protein [Cytophagia bacterium]
MTRVFYDSVNFLTKTNFKRAVNHSKILLSYQQSTFYKKPSIKGLPISISIEPTTSCNLRCPECPSGL